MKKAPTKVKDKPKNDLADELDQVPIQSDSAEIQVADENSLNQPEDKTEAVKDEGYYHAIFERWENEGVFPTDFEVAVPIDSLESAVGYSSLFRQMHQAFRVCLNLEGEN